jgi:glycosyltransferase involved in cell wall biosynthesis
VSRRDRLLFVSPRFLFPADSGGKIRTSEILRNLKGGRFEITLVSPETGDEAGRFAREVTALCDRVAYWPKRAPSPWRSITRMRYLTSSVPIAVATDRSRRGAELVARELAHGPGLAVFDFPHAAVLAPAVLGCPSVLFTHNVEAEIFARHVQVARDPFTRWVWQDQHGKMRDFEQATLARFDRVIAVSERDRGMLTAEYGARDVSVIPTGVDLEHFAYGDPEPNQRVVFAGSMDWMANIDGIAFFMDAVWPRVAAAVPAAEMTVVGRSPPEQLLDRARGLRWTFTGRVDDIRPHVRRAAAYAIPLRVGGGTRIKAFEAMAMGVPVVSTAIGVEGLDIVPGRHFLLGDTAEAMALGLVRLLTEPEAGLAIARAARTLVETRFSNAEVARCFERICGETLDARRPADPPSPGGVVRRA